jgi:hypothetical protein
VPGLLKESALCPICTENLIAACRTSTLKGTTYEFHHDKQPGKRRHRPCVERVPADLVAKYETDVYNPLHVGR